MAEPRRASQKDVGAEVDAVLQADMVADVRPSRPRNGDRLRVAVMLDGTTGPDWVRAVLDDVNASDRADVVLYILRRPTTDAPRSHLSPGRIARGVRSRWRTYLFYRYAAADYERHRAPIDAFAPIDVRTEIESRETMFVEPITGAFSDTFSRSDLDALRQRHIDVILRFGFRILRGDVLAVARYGVWSFHHGDNRRHRGGPAFFWEILHGDPVCGTVLQRLTEELDQGKILHRSFSATNFTSLYATRNAAYWKAVGAVRRCLEDVAALGWDHVAGLYPDESQAGRAPLHRVPATPTMLLFFARLRLRTMAARLRAWRVEERWTIAVRKRSGSAPWQGGEPFRLARPPAGHFYADPFLMSRDGRTFVFFEDFDHGAHKGRICFAEISDGVIGPAQVAIDADHHLSYPFVFEWNNEIYMVPESAQRSRIDLYRAVSFPREWERVQALRSDIVAVDPTIVRAGERFWLFAGIAPRGAPAEHELHLFYADDLLGPWHAHRGNPVSSDIRSARPAGRPFRSEYGFLRPGQDCSVRYGHAIALSIVRHINPDTYMEEPFRTITASLIGDCAGTHTFDRDDRYEIVDGVVVRPRIAGALAELVSRLRPRRRMDA